MLIIAGHLVVAASDREAYLAATDHIAREARATEGCVDFVQAADRLDPTRITIFERWDAEEPMLAFRERDHSVVSLPAILDADVHRYVIASIDAP